MGTTQPIRNKDELTAFRMYYKDIRPNSRNYCLIVMGLNTALRISDLLRLKWDNVYNFKHHEFRTHFLINEQKTGKNNYVTLNCNATDALKDYFNERNPNDHEFIFKQKIALDTSQSDTKLTVSAISIAGGKKPDKLKQLTAQMTINSHDTAVDLKFDDNTVHFYVYAKGDVIFASDNISDAIKQANDSMGVVIDSNQQYVWMRARKNAVNAFANIACNETDKDADSVVKSVSAMLTYNDVTVSVSELIGAGSSAVDVLKNNLPDKEILDLQGVSSEDIIFYISQGNPVFAMTGNTSAVLVTGYSSNGALYIYNPDNGATTSMSYEDADRMFYNGGLHFITYMTK